MKALLQTFIDDDDGAVTVDWIVLTAALVGLGIGVISVFNTGTTNLATEISGQVGTITVDNEQSN